MSQISEAAARGAQFLDERQPGWAERIDTESLSMIRPCRCIIGQLSGSRYSAGFQKIVNEGHPAYSEHAQSLGFVIDAEWDDQWDQLTGAWLKEIEKRTK